MSRVEVFLTEREGEKTENHNHYSINYDDDGLHLDDVLRAFENALKGFGYVMDNKRLKVVDEDEVDRD